MIKPYFRDDKWSNLFSSFLFSCYIYSCLKFPWYGADAFVCIVSLCLPKIKKMTTGIFQTRINTHDNNKTRNKVWSFIISNNVSISLPWGFPIFPSQDFKWPTPYRLISGSIIKTSVLKLKTTPRLTLGSTFLRVFTVIKCWFM